MPYAYMLQCKDGSYYVGSTVDLDRRVAEHNFGVGANYTKPRRRRPVRVVWVQEFQRIDEAFAVEKQVQGWSRAKRQALIDGRIEDLAGLASRSRAAVERRGERERGDGG